MRKAFTLLELIIVIIIVGILSTLGISQYSIITEKTLDKEVKVVLKLIQAAEKSFHMANGDYYPASGAANDLNLINTNLKLSLPVSTRRNWNYAACYSGCVSAQRNGSDSRVWRLEISESEPVSGSCTACP